MKCESLLRGGGCRGHGKIVECERSLRAAPVLRRARDYTSLSKNESVSWGHDGGVRTDFRSIRNIEVDVRILSIVVCNVELLLFFGSRNLLRRRKDMIRECCIRQQKRQLQRCCVEAWGNGEQHAACTRAWE